MVPVTSCQHHDICVDGAAVVQYDLAAVYAVNSEHFLDIRR